MANNLKQMISAGLDSIYLGFADSDGVFAGTVKAPVNGTDSGGFVVIGPQTANITIPPMERVNIPGSDGRLGTFQFDSDTETAVEFETGALDFDIAAATDNKTLDVVDTNYTLLGLRPGARTPQSMWMVMNVQAKSQASATLGVAHWLIFIMKGELSYLGPTGVANKGGHLHRWSCLINPSSIYPWGETPADADTYDGWVLAAENRMRLHRHTGDGADDEMVLSSTPVSLAKISLWINGTQKTRTTDYTLSGSTVTFDATEVTAAGVDSVAFYEFSV
jgi:hypothetical protein